MEVFQTAASIVECYSVGRSEAAAAANLLNNIDEEIGQALSNLVQPLDGNFSEAQAFNDIPLILQGSIRWHDS